MYFTGAMQNPSISVLLCRRKDDEVVEYALSRNLSPALVAEYETKMISKQLLQQKLHEWREMLEASRLLEAGLGGTDVKQQVANMRSLCDK